MLYPTYGILRDYKSGVINEIEYEERYKTEVLSKLNPLDVAR